MQQQQLLLPATTIQSIYSSSSSAIISTSITITPSKFKFKFNYTRAAAAAAAAASDSNKHPHRPNLLHFDDYYYYNNTETTSPAEGNNATKCCDTNALNFQTTDTLSLNSDDAASASPRIKTKTQTMNRSSILAKQVITVHSANTLGFVSQLWLHPTSVSITLFSF